MGGPLGQPPWGPRAGRGGGALWHQPWAFLTLSHPIGTKPGSGGARLGASTCQGGGGALQQHPRRPPRGRSEGAPLTPPPTKGCVGGPRPHPGAQPGGRTGKGGGLAPSPAATAPLREGGRGEAPPGAPHKMAAGHKMAAARGRGGRAGGSPCCCGGVGGCGGRGAPALALSGCCCGGGSVCASSEARKELRPRPGSALPL